MISLRQGNKNDAAQLASLILLSAPSLLPFMFGSRQAAMSYLMQASEQADGQYSATRHHVATDGQKPIACMSLWHSEMPASFQQSTVESLGAFLSAEQLAHIIDINDLLANVFLAPKENELCIGHLAVEQKWQGMQVASKLLARALQEARRIKKQSLVLDVEEDNHAALAFYQKWGFISVKRNLFQPTDQYFLRMSRSAD